jgi:hypothetical protein
MTTRGVRKTFVPKTTDQMRDFAEQLRQTARGMKKALYSKDNKKAPENRPDPKEFKEVESGIADLSKMYKTMCAVKKRKKNTGTSKNVGFNAPIYIVKDAVKFINDNIPDQHRIQKSSVTSDGRGIFTRAQLTSFFTDYIEKNGLKMVEQPSLIVLSRFPRDLMRLVVQQVDELRGKDKKNGKAFIKTVDGQEVFDHAGLQFLLTALVFSELQVINKTDNQQRQLDSRCKFLEAQSSENRARKLESRKLAREDKARLKAQEAETSA